MLNAVAFVTDYCCPRCHGALMIDGDSLRCSDGDCSLSAAGSFPIVKGQPILVDFETSVFDRAAMVRSAEMPAGPPRALSDCTGTRPSLKTRRPGSAAPPTPSDRTVAHSSWRRALHLLFFGENAVAWRNAKRFLVAMKSATSPRRPTLLLVGGASKGKGTEPLYEDRAIDRVSFDVYHTPYTQFIADGHQIPLPDGSVDGVWVQAVLEHVLVPEQVVGEMHRVLRPGGVIYDETPFMQQVHMGPYDFTRFTDSGHRWLFRRFRCLDSGPVAGPGVTLLWSIRYALSGLFRSRKLGLVLCLPFFWVRFLDFITPRDFSIDGASGFFFFGVKDRDTLSPKDAIRLYQGAQRV